MKKKQKILVAMSGGVDSSVAAALLVKQGYNVSGAFMVNYDEKISPHARGGGEGGVGSRCWTGDYRDALRVAAKLGIKLLKLDFTRKYKRDVLDYMYSEYKAGRTPNPDVLCNKFIKFGAWLDKARALGFDKLATGHYAFLPPLIKGERKGGGVLHLLQSKDLNKDQTYFLNQLSQAQLRHVLFPIGEYAKPQVRALAKKFGLPTAEKEESMGICFIGEVPMKEFLMKKIKFKPGNIVLSLPFTRGEPPPRRGPASRRWRERGKVVGQHDGLAFYTIGQRISLSFPRLSTGESSALPLFVVGKNIKKNELIVGDEKSDMLYSMEARVKDVNWISGNTPNFPLKCQVRLRHRQPLQRCTVSLPLVTFTHPQRAVTPGQFAVFYLKGECLGGGVIA
ncbi:tRNA 2-thiouridine(34) synthase MnmA [Patescibacteria group bacterium]|nr:MAG: tRNA 2-thiouridine(34) synthase MnmA [Patescibacteria group bacterium]